METFVYTFSVKAEDVRSKVKILSPTFDTPYNNDVSFTWQFGFDPSKPSIDLRLIKMHENLPKKVVRAQAMFMLCTKSGATCKSTSFHTFSLTNYIPVDKCEVFSNCWFWFFDFPSFNEQIPMDVYLYTDCCMKFVCKIAIPHEMFMKSENPVVDTPLPKRENRQIPDNFLVKLFEKVEIGNCRLGSRHRIGTSPNIARSSPKKQQSLEFSPTKSFENTKSDILSDLIFISSDKRKFRCHRFAFYAFSDAFATQLFGNADCQGNASLPWVVEMDDIEGDALLEMLRFVYTKKFGSKLDNLAEKCLYVAEKYDLTDMKAYCVAVLKLRVNHENVFRYLEIANRYSLLSLNRVCGEIIRLCFHSFDESRLHAFFSMHPSIVSEVLKPIFHRSTGKDDVLISI